MESTLTLTINQRSDGLLTLYSKSEDTDSILSSGTHGSFLTTEGLIKEIGEVLKSVL
jgi:hypothetical protein